MRRIFILLLCFIGLIDHRVELNSPLKNWILYSLSSPDGNDLYPHSLASIYTRPWTNNFPSPIQCRKLGNPDAPSRASPSRSSAAFFSTS